MTDADKTTMLLRLFDGDPHVAAELRTMVRDRMASDADAPPIVARTVGELRSRAAAPTKNIENNPMHSSRRPPQPTVWTENLTRRANQRHNFIIPKSDQRPRARNACCPV